MELKKWCIAYIQRNEAVVQQFVSLMTKLSPKMGMKVSQPELLQLKDDRTETFLKAIRDSITPAVQLVVAIMPTPRDDRYQHSNQSGFKYRYLLQVFRCEEALLC